MKVGIRNDATRNMPAIQTMERWVERPWIDHGGGTWTRQYIRPLRNTQSYGRQFSWETSQITLALLLDLPREDIETLMIRFLQTGIDLYGVTDSAADSGAGVGRFDFSTQGHLWQGAGGISAGRKLQMLFPAIMLGDENMLGYADAGGFRSYHEISRSDWKSGPGYPIFQAEQQHFYVHEDDTVAKGGVYPNNELGLPEWGSSYLYNGAAVPAFGGNYRWMTNAYAGAVLAGHMIQYTGTYENGIERTGRQLWNWEPIFDYMDRWVKADEDGEHSSWSGGTGTNYPRPFVKDMWEEYRSDYGPLWTP